MQKCPAYWTWKLADLTDFGVLTMFAENGPALADLAAEVRRAGGAQSAFPVVTPAIPTGRLFRGASNLPGRLPVRSSDLRSGRWRRRARGRRRPPAGARRGAARGLPGKAPGLRGRDRRLPRQGQEQTATDFNPWQRRYEGAFLARRISGFCGRQLGRWRSERVERSFAHTCETGAGRRTWLRDVVNVSKSYLGRTAAHNLGIIMLALFGIGTARSL